MKGPDGVEWLRPAEAARAVRVRRSVIDNWVARGKVTRVRIGRRAWVRMPDVREAEAAWVRRVRRDREAS